jgi:nucleoside 2-deoxyribosyltransferase
VACVRLLNDLREAEFILLARPHIDALNVSLTLKGVERADAVTRLRPQEENAFVAMWFDPVMDPAYEAMKRALEACGYDGPFRVSDPDHDKTVDGPDYTPKIDDRIMAGIRRARFIIADATGARPAVYYEAGFAEGLGTPIIWTCKKDSAKDDPTFDTRQLEHIFWTDENDLEEKLKAKIQRRGWNRRVG